MHLESITWIPFDPNAINPDLMSEEERQMMNDYHKLVYEVTSPYLDDEEKEWLKKYTREI